MWPFGKKTPPPPDVTQDGVTARYDTRLKHWAFTVDGIEFNLTGVPFNEAAFSWAKEAAAIIRGSDPRIRARVLDCLGDWPCDKSKAELLCVYLDEYGATKTMDLAYAGDDSWGDFGVNVIITDGKIVDVYGGD